MLTQLPEVNIDSLKSTFASLSIEKLLPSLLALIAGLIIAKLLCKLFEYYMRYPEALPEDFHPQLSFEGLERTVCDYIAGMTDNYAVDKYTEIFIPSGWNVRG